VTGADADAIRFADIDWSGRPVTIEYAWIGRERPDRRDRPLVVFLHEGLGSLAMWRGFPRMLCDGTNLRGLVYSRPGYGRSTPRAPNERWGVDFMHRQADEVLPAFLAAVGVDPIAAPLWLFGHSDGGSIALLHAARFPRAVAAVIAVAPHIFVEEVSVTSIEAARRAYLDTDLRNRLAQYHDDVDSAFWGWNDVWLDPAFRNWTIVDRLPLVRCPVLAVQGEDDEYGTMAQVDGIARAVPQARRVKLAGCGHSPHRDQPERLLAAVKQFMEAVSPSAMPR
jgi:pimeloyl-ACP methyl ester carboxylesterase